MFIFRDGSGSDLIISSMRSRGLQKRFRIERVLLAGQRRVEQLMAAGRSRTPALKQAAGELGVPWGTLRDRLSALVLEKGTP